MLAVNVSGGTSAGRRIIRKPAQDWYHHCVGRVPYRGVLLDATVRLEACVKRCPACGCKRS